MVKLNTTLVTKDTPELLSFLDGMEKIVFHHFSKNFKNLTPPSFEVNNGRRYYRVEIVDNQKSAFCFIDRANGDVLKPATWRAPAKHARGNIFNEDNGLDCMGPHGPAYLK